jgi:hypothetical protein
MLSLLIRIAIYLPFIITKNLIFVFTDSFFSYRKNVCRKPKRGHLIYKLELTIPILRAKTYWQAANHRPTHHFFIVFTTLLSLLWFPKIYYIVPYFLRGKPPYLLVLVVRHRLFSPTRYRGYDGPYSATAIGVLFGVGWFPTTIYPNCVRASWNLPKAWGLSSLWHAKI